MASRTAGRKESGTLVGLRAWRNGIGADFRCRCSREREGSSPSAAPMFTLVRWSDRALVLTTRLDAQWKSLGRAGKPTGRADSHGYVEVSNMTIPNRFIAIQSVTFSNTQRSVFLRMDGSNVTQYQGGGSGTVNCQFYAPGTLPVPEIGNLEAFELISIANAGVAIRSVNFPNAFLRLDAQALLLRKARESVRLIVSFIPPERIRIASPIGRFSSF